MDGCRLQSTQPSQIPSAHKSAWTHLPTRRRLGTQSRLHSPTRPPSAGHTIPPGLAYPPAVGWAHNPAWTHLSVRRRLITQSRLDPPTRQPSADPPTPSFAVLLPFHNGLIYIHHLWHTTYDKANQRSRLPTKLATFSTFIIEVKLSKCIVFSLIAAALSFIAVSAIPFDQITFQIKYTSLMFVGRWDGQTE